MKRASQPDVEIIHQDCITDGVVVRWISYDRIDPIAERSGNRRTSNHVRTHFAQFPRAIRVDRHSDLFQTDFVAARKVSKDIALREVPADGKGVTDEEVVDGGTIKFPLRPTIEEVCKARNAGREVAGQC